MKTANGMAIRRTALVLFLLMGLLAGSCRGKKGSQGPQGPSGTDGPTRTVLDRTEDLPGLVLSITQISGASGADKTFQTGDAISITFTVTKSNESNLPLSELDYAGILVSGPSFNYQRVLDLRTDLIAASVKNYDGSYTYTFSDRIPSTYLPPLNDSVSIGPGDGELGGQTLLAGSYTVGIEAYKNYTVEGTVYKDAGNATKDFLFGGATTLEPREVVTRAHCNQCHVNLQAHGGFRRDVLLCLLCHTSGAEDRNDPTIAGGTPGASIDSRVLFHKIHNGSHLPSVLGVTTNSDGSRNHSGAPVAFQLVRYDNSIADFSDVAFPVWPSLDRPMPKNLGYSALSSTSPSETDNEKARDDTVRKGVVACAKCHGDPDGSGPLAAPAQGGLAETQPTRRGCGSCHDDVNWSYPYAKNGRTMGPQANDGSCAASGCHGPTDNLGVEAAHRHPIVDGARNPGVNFSITGISGGTGTGGNFLAGDTLALTFTMKNDAGADIALESLDSTSAALVGPTTNRQFVLPNSSVSPFDFSGRLAASSTSNRATMSKVIGGTIAEILKVQFTSATAFTVTGIAADGTSNGSRGSAALPASSSTNPASSSLSAVTLAPGALAQTITVAFSSATAFAVSGSSSGAMGSGALPASTSASTRFISTDGTVAFIITVGSNPFASGNNIYLTIFQGTTNPVLLAVVAGRSSVAANDRFYYEVNPAASSYTVPLPMDITLEFLGDGDGNIGQTLTAANTPVYYGRQTLYERTALAGAATTLSANASAGDRSVDVVDVLAATLAKDDYVILDDGAAGKEEYLRVSSIDTANKRIWMTAPLRYAHASGSSFQEATLTFRQEGVNYTLDPASGTITSVVAFASGNAMVMSYRTQAKFGWKRDLADTLQATYFSPIGDSTDFDETWGEWKNLSFVSGTYSLGIWGYKNLDLGLQNEVQTYRCTSVAATKDFLYGTATEIEPRAAISSQGNCDSCHSRVLFHGGGRRGAEACFFCHGESGAQTQQQPTRAGESIEFRVLLHKIHMGEGLTNAADFFDGDFEEVTFPAAPGEPENCRTCHGSENEAWKSPAPRNHEDQSSPTRAWRTACGSCHDSLEAGAHFNVQTDGAGNESCGVCHGTDADLRVELMHKVR